MNFVKHLPFLLWGIGILGFLYTDSKKHNFLHRSVPDMDNFLPIHDLWIPNKEEGSHESLLCHGHRR